MNTTTTTAPRMALARAQGRSRMAPRRLMVTLLLAVTILAGAPALGGTAEASGGARVYASCGSSFNYNQRTGHMRLQFDRYQRSITHFRVILRDEKTGRWGRWSAWHAFGSRSRATQATDLPPGAKLSAWVKWYDSSTGRMWNDRVVFGYMFGAQKFYCWDGL